LVTVEGEKPSIKNQTLAQKGACETIRGEMELAGEIA